MNWVERLRAALAILRGEVEPPQGGRSQPETPESRVAPSRLPTKADAVSSRSTPSRSKPQAPVCIIGLDFGTSCTKVVVGARGHAYAVPFPGHTLVEWPYLLPTRLWMRAGGELTLNKIGEGRWVSHLKVDLMERPWQRSLAAAAGGVQEPVVFAAAYLGIVIRSVRAWFLTETRAVLGTSEVIWQLNVGLPARSHEEGPIRIAFWTAA